MNKVSAKQIWAPILLVIVCVLFNIIISGHYFHSKLSSDENLYNLMANAIFNGDSYYVENGEKVDLGFEVTPFFSYFIAFTYLIAGKSIVNIIVLNVFLNCLTILFLYFTIILIVRNVLISFLLSFAFIFYFLLWGFNFYIMMEITTVFFLSITIYLFTKYYYNKTTYFLYLAVAFFSLLVLINNRFVVLFIAFYGFQLFLTIVEKLNFRKLFIYPIIISIFVIAPWFIRQAIIYEHFVLFTPTWNNLVADKTGFLRKINMPTDADDITIGKPKEFIFYSNFIEREYGVSDPLRGSQSFTIEKYNNLVKSFNNGQSIYLNRLQRYFTLYNSDFKFMAPNDYRILVPDTIPYKIIQLLILLPLFTFSILGLIIALFKKNWIIVLLGLLFISHILLHVIIHYIDRYRLTILPVLVIITGYGIVQILPKVKSTLLFYAVNNKNV